MPGGIVLYHGTVNFARIRCCLYQVDTFDVVQSDSDQLG